MVGRKARAKKERQFQRDEQASPKNPPSISYWAVGFLDLLGYSRVLQAFDVYPLPTEGPDHHALVKAFARATHLRTRLLDAMENLMSSRLGTLPVDLNRIPQALRSAANGWRQIRMISSPGPDHVILGCSLAPSPGHFPMYAVDTLVLGCASAMLVQLRIGGDDTADSLPLRGGLEIAPGGVYGADDFLYTPALSKAHDLESKHAVYARTLIGERFEGFISSQAREKPNTVQELYEVTLAQRLERMFFHDTDGLTVLDFLAEPFRERLDSTFAQDLCSKAWLFARRAERDARARRDYKVAMKYSWLVDFMAGRLRLWGVQS